MAFLKKNEQGQWKLAEPDAGIAGVADTKVAIVPGHSMGGFAVDSRFTALTFLESVLTEIQTLKELREIIEWTRTMERARALKQSVVIWTQA